MDNFDPVKSGLMMEFKHPDSGNMVLITTVKFMLASGYPREVANKEVAGRIRDLESAGFRRVIKKQTIGNN
jgi:hypothetical protein